MDSIHNTHSNVTASQSTSRPDPRIEVAHALKRKLMNIAPTQGPLQFPRMASTQAAPFNLPAASDFLPSMEALVDPSPAHESNQFLPEPRINADAFLLPQLPSDPLPELLKEEPYEGKSHNRMLTDLTLLLDEKAPVTASFDFLDSPESEPEPADSDPAFQMFLSDIILSSAQRPHDNTTAPQSKNNTSSHTNKINTPKPRKRTRTTIPPELRKKGEDHNSTLSYAGLRGRQQVAKPANVQKAGENDNLHRRTL